MLQNKTKVNVTDNSGAVLVEIIGIMGASNQRYAKIGTLVKVAIKKVFSGKCVPNVGKGKTSYAVVVRTTRGVRRATGIRIRFAENAVVLVKDDRKTLVGTRMFGSTVEELKKYGFPKVCTLAKTVY
jgi:large subunit ribosomal protein L14